MLDAQSQRTYYKEGIALCEDDMIEVEMEDVIPRPANDKERLDVLEQKMERLSQSIDSLYPVIKDMRNKVNGKKYYAIQNEMANTKNGLRIPNGTELVGVTKGIPYFLITRNGQFFVGTSPYESLSAAAEGVSGTRRSGWTFWKLPDGRTVKEVFKDANL